MCLTGADHIPLRQLHRLLQNPEQQRRERRYSAVACLPQSRFVIKCKDKEQAELTVRQVSREPNEEVGIPAVDLGVEGEVRHEIAHEWELLFLVLTLSGQNDPFVNLFGWCPRAGIGSEESIGPNLFAS